MDNPAKPIYIAYNGNVVGMEDSAELPRVELKKRLQSNVVKIVEPKQVFQVGDKVRLRKAF